MPVIAIKKSQMPPLHKSKKSAIQHLTAASKDPSEYDFFYVYKEQRWRYAKSYPELHRKAALRSYHKNKTTTRPVGRPRKTDGNNQG